MDITQYLSSVLFNKTITKLAENAKFETTEKTKSNFKLVATEAFNEGISHILSRKSAPKKGTLEKSKEITKMTPDAFCRGEFGSAAITNIVESVKSCQSDGILNIGYESIIRDDVENMVRIIYALGVSTGFDIAGDEDYKRLYLENKDRFILHGSTPKTEKPNNKQKETNKQKD